MVPPALLQLDLEPIRLLGSGSEGVVYLVAPDLVAKVWNSRPVVDLVALERFYAQIDGCLPFATPRILSVHSGTEPVTIERYLPGTPVPDSCAALEAVLTCLRALRTLEPGPARALGFRGHHRSNARSSADLANWIEPAELAGMPPLVPDLRIRVAALTEALLALEPMDDTVVHGDVFGPNILIKPFALLDFGFMTLPADPRLDAAISAAAIDMYAQPSHRFQLTQAVASALDYDPAVLVLYQAAYAVLTATLFGSTLDDGHFTWCARLLADHAVSSVLGLSHP